MKERRAITLIVALVLIIALGVWYYEAHESVAYQSSVQNDSTVSITNSSTKTIDTSSWQKYHNAIYGYTVSYPPDASVQYDTITENNNAPGGVQISPAASSVQANDVSIIIDTSTYSNILTNASVHIFPAEFFVGATGIGIGDLTVSSTFTLDDIAYPAMGIDGNADDGSMFMDAQVGKLDIGYLFSSADAEAVSEPDFSEIQNALIAIVQTIHFDNVSQ